MLRQGIVLAVLFVAALGDVRNRMIPKGIHILMAVCCLIPPAEVQPGGIVAALPLLLAALWKGGVGGGDVKIMAAMGLVLGFYRASLILFLALVLLVFWHMGRKLIGKGERAYPLVPFLFSAAVLTIRM